MDGFKEFQGKDLDNAINEACTYFNLVREKLEIEILQDAKSGIFGIVVARKAKIRARRAQLSETRKNLLGRKTSEETPPARTDLHPSKDKDKDEAENVPDASSVSGVKMAFPEDKESGEIDGRNSRHTRKNGAGKKVLAKEANQGRDVKKTAPIASDDVMAYAGSVCELADDSPDTASDMSDLSDLSLTPLEELDPKRLQTFALETASKIVGEIVGESADIAVEVCRARVRVMVDCPRSSGLLIGRDGQTLDAVQYLLSRIISRSMNTAVRVQLDAGNYRQKQEDKLKALAFALAEKAHHHSGRAFSTRPLSSYHRRIVHLSLQNIPDIQTKSVGEGPLKRVVIQRQKTEK